MKTVTDPQIDRLFEFTKQHYVEWYDVQIELVDHLANGIENQWKEAPDIPFEKALNIEFKKFGIFGFSDLVEEKTAALNKFYRKKVWFYFKTFFKLPVIVGTLFYMGLLFLVLHHLENKLYVLVPFLIIFFLTLSMYSINQKKQIKTRFIKTQKKWLIDNEFMQLGGLIHVLNLIFSFQGLYHTDMHWTLFSELLLSIGLVVFVLLFYVSMKIIPVKLKAKIAQEHPEYNFS